MPGYGQCKLTAVWAMMKICAPGSKVKKTIHYFRIDYNDKRYPTLPTGEHKRRPEIELGHVRKMARHFGIQDCAKRELGY